MLLCPGFTLFGKSAAAGALGDPIEIRKRKKFFGNPFAHPPDRSNAQRNYVKESRKHPLAARSAAASKPSRQTERQAGLLSSAFLAGAESSGRKRQPERPARAAQQAEQPAA